MAFETNSLRESIGALQWLTNESRPDLAVQVNMLQLTLSDFKVRGCWEANNIIRRAEQHRGFWSIPEEN